MNLKKILTPMLLLAGLLLVAAPQPCLADVYLVSVGIADYPGNRNDLSLPAKDATTMANLYRRNNNAHTKLLTNAQATVENIRQAMERMYAQAGQNDIVVFFFSGHGTQGAFCAYDKLLDYDTIRKAMARSKSRNKMIFADACFSGKMRTNGRHTAHRKSNVMLFLSSRSNETSIESPSMRNGFFTVCLERSLRGGADADRNRVITAKELFDAVSAGVVKLSDGKQHPVMWGNFSDTMPVMVWEKKTGK